MKIYVFEIMALFIPSRRPTVKPDASVLDRSSRRSVQERPQSWNQLRLQEAFEQLARGDVGRFDSEQLSRIRTMIEHVAGADGVLSTAQTREAIHTIEANRVSLGLDKSQAEALMNFLAVGPAD